ncbi:MAG: phage baseplate assembly protein V [Geobacter sp.]|nr:phage baseplate assembly protein V [Geobacter sp.]
MKIGIVTATDPATCSARVQFPAHDGMVTAPLPVMQKKSLRDKQYWMPDVGEQVVCLMDENEEFGVIAGAIYSDADAPPVGSQDKYHVRFDDGTWIEYDRASHTLAAHVVAGTLEATVDISATITSPLIRAVASSKVQCDTPLTECTGNLVVNGGITCLGSYGGSGGKIITPGDIQSTNGNLLIAHNAQIGGNVTAGGSVIDSGGNTNHHTH